MSGTFDLEDFLLSGEVVANLSVFEKNKTKQQQQQSNNLFCKCLVDIREFHRLYLQRH